MIDQPFEAGPLARMTINGDYSGGVSVMDRHKARAHEALKIAFTRTPQPIVWEEEGEGASQVVPNKDDAGTGLTAH